MTVKRIGEESGWEEALQIQVLKTEEGPSEIMDPNAVLIDVGASEENEMVVELPEEGMTCVPDQPWSEKFSVSIEGNQMTVKRIDEESGWEEAFQIQVLPAEEEPPPEEEEEEEAAEEEVPEEEEPPPEEEEPLPEEEE